MLLPASLRLLALPVWLGLGATGARFTAETPQLGLAGAGMCPCNGTRGASLTPRRRSRWAQGLLDLAGPFRVSLPIISDTCPCCVLLGNNHPLQGQKLLSLS